MNNSEEHGEVIAIGSDHAGFELKEAVRAFLEKEGHTVLDFGTNSKDSCDYPDYARKVAQSVSQGESFRGVICCGSGIGVSIVANKVRRVRAALVHDKEQAMLSRQHNDANVLCLAGRSTKLSDLAGILSTWLSTEFEGGRHERRVKKIEVSRAFEQGLFG
ncbi:MAG: ribose 5-phosphate isomerase B [Candidatus Melainabacteria bacterium]|nr:ribose 5-phosphate isomerase B [Candidatus Melainabacteria bacterium]OPZ86690.1 MAG: putative ribose-5-phosphate isomerase B [bacterium ADurb.Bin425]